jgi:hypothetical protein
MVEGPEMSRRREAEPSDNSAQASLSAEKLLGLPLFSLPIMH